MRSTVLGFDVYNYLQTLQSTHQ